MGLNKAHTHCTLRHTVVVATQNMVMNGGVDRIITDISSEKVDTISRTHKIMDDAKKIRYNKELHKMALEMC